MKKKSLQKKLLRLAGEDYLAEPLSAEQEKLRAWFRTVHFRKNLFGGINERQLWKKLDELNHLYEEALIAERARYDALLAAKDFPVRTSLSDDGSGAPLWRDYSFGKHGGGADS